MIDDGSTAPTILAMALITIVTRGSVLIPRHEVPIPRWLQSALKVAPLAARVAVVVPGIVTDHGQLIHTWQDARLAVVAAATLYDLWRPRVLGPLLAGLALFLPLRLVLGW